MAGAGPTVVHLEAALPLDRLRSEHPQFPLIIHGLTFSTDEPDRAQWLVETSYVGRPIATRVPRARRILIICEPRGNFTAAYSNQFGILISPYTIPGYRGVWIQDHGALAVWLGRDLADGPLDYQGLMNLPPPAKQDTISVVTSRKSVLPGHRRRLAFLRALQDALGPRLAIYGKGFRPIRDKAEAILPAKYHLVMENTVMPSYWTEKLADAYLGYALPIVIGPPDLERWFPPESFVRIDLNDTAGSIATMKRALDEDIYARHFDAIVEARTRLMREERLAPVVARAIETHPNSEPLLAVPETIRPVPNTPLLQRITREVARFYWQIDEEIRKRTAQLRRSHDVDAS